MTQLPSSRFPHRHRFGQWDGSQALPFDADDVMGALAEDLMEYGDLRWAMKNLMSRGMQMPQGGSLEGLRQMLKQLREQKRAQLERYDLSSILDGFAERLEEILDMEHARIDEWLGDDGAPGQAEDSRTASADPSADRSADPATDASAEAGGATGLSPDDPSDDPPDDPPGSDRAAPGGAGADDGPFSSDQFSGNVLKSIARRNRDTLAQLPEQTAGRIKALEKYEFLNPDAQRAFLELLNELRKAMAQTFFRDIEDMVQNLSDGDLARMKEMLKDLNDMLVKKIAGEDPDFDSFMQKHGDMFGDNPPRSLDELLEQMAQQMAAAQSLLNSLSADQRAQLQSLLSDRFGDPELESELRKLAKEMDFLNPESSQYQFTGGQDIDLDAAMELMREMQQIDDVMAQLQDAERAGDLDSIDPDLLREVMGDDAADNLDELKQLMEALEAAGYIRPAAGDKYELTPRGTRMIGQKALGEIYARLKRQSLGNHAIPEEGRFGERLEQTKVYEYGDPFHLHMPRTLRNAIDRNGPGTPVRLQVDDFEIYRSELITSTATAMLVDLSWSMALRGSFQAAKKVALALHNLITSQYPKDSFYIIGFAAYAKELKPHDLPYLQWDEYVLGTNMQHALLMADRLLARHNVGTKQIIMISDGEPTAHLENGHAQFAYPPTPETIRATFRAVKHCTRRGIAINTFMLESSHYLRAFMDQIAKINGGRVFFTSPEELGEYILVDYVQHKRTRLARRT